MNVTNQDANIVNEATHGYQIYNGTFGVDELDREVPAYQRQYAFDPSTINSFVPSDTGLINERSDIDQIWVLGINYTEDHVTHYIYDQKISPVARQSIIKDYKEQKKAQQK